MGERHPAKDESDLSSEFRQFGIVMGIIFAAMGVLFSLQSNYPDSFVTIITLLSFAVAYGVSRWIGGRTGTLIRAGLRGAVLIGTAAAVSAGIGEVVRSGSLYGSDIWHRASFTGQTAALFGGMIGAMEPLHTMRRVMIDNLAALIAAMCLTYLAKSVLGVWAGGAVGVVLLSLCIGIIWRDYRPGETPHAPSPMSHIFRLFRAGFGGMFYGALSHTWLSMIGLSSYSEDPLHPKDQVFWMIVILLGGVIGTLCKAVRERRGEALQHPWERL